MPVVSGPGPVHRTTPAASRNLGDDGSDLPELHMMIGVAFDVSTVPMVLVDKDHQVRCANRSATDLLGDEALVGRSMLGLFRSSGELQDLEALRELADEPDVVEAWANLELESGRQLPVMMRLNGLVGPTGDRLYLLQLRDLTPSFWHFASDLPPHVSAFLFDRDLRIVTAVGKGTGSGRYKGGSLRGQLLRDVLPLSAVQALQVPYLAAMGGQSSSFDYSSPIDGAHYRMSVRPVTAGTDDIQGILVITEDVSAERVRHDKLEQIHQLSRLGSCWFSVPDGWACDEELMALVGISSSAEVITAMDLLVLPEDRPQALATYRRVLQAGGKATLQYRLIHGRTGELLHVASAVEAVVDDDGTLLRAILTLADVTEAVRAEADRATAARARTVLLRKISDAITGQSQDLAQLMQNIADVTAAALGDWTVLRVLSPDGRDVEAEIVSVSDDKTGAAADHVDCLRRQLHQTVPGAAERVRGADIFFSSIDNTDWRGDFAQHLGYPVDARIHHVISAPIRHQGSLLGFLRTFRLNNDNPYLPGDDDLVQVLADRVGAAIAEQRVRDLLEAQRTQARVIGDRLQELTAEQRELLEQLATVEERERTLLAEAIHDGPMQLIVAVMMRMENFGSTAAPVDLAEVEALVDTLETSVQRLRTLIIALTPPDLSDGLRTALDVLAQGIFIGTGTQIRIAGVTHVGLTPLRMGNAYRILREALVNVRKHARAKHVSVDLAEREAVVIARIVDDGIGATVFDAGPGHLGMATMRARAGAEGGHLSVRSTPDVGTTVVLTLPANRTIDREHRATEDFSIHGEQLAG